MDAVLELYYELSNIKLPQEETDYPRCVLDAGVVTKTSKKVTLKYQTRDMYVDKDKTPIKKKGGSAEWANPFSGKDKRVVIISHIW